MIHLSECNTLRVSIYFLIPEWAHLCKNWLGQRFTKDKPELTLILCLGLLLRLPLLKLLRLAPGPHLGGGGVKLVEDEVHDLGENEEDPPGPQHPASVCCRDGAGLRLDSIANNLGLV